MYEIKIKTGETINKCASLAVAKHLVDEYEKMDKKFGIYCENNYTIVSVGEEE